MEMKKDITTLDEVKNLVDTFYEKVALDDLIGPIFIERLEGHWESHLNRMYTFWQTVLLNERTYEGRPFPPHLELPIHEMHFLRWLALFEETVFQYYQGENASYAIEHAKRMAKQFQLKLKMARLAKNSTHIS